MLAIDDYREKMKEFINPDDGLFYNFETPDMSDMENWVCVHVTKYKPRRNQKGQLYIPTTGMATGNKYPRATIHFTINQIVASHTGGNWDASPIVVLAPYNDIVKTNGEPRMVASEDTFFIPNPDTGLILPSSAHIVKPNNNTLFSIGDNISTYKTDNFTNKELELILSFMEPGEREEYEQYDNADLKDYELQHILKNERVKQSYEKSNKHEFLKGLLAEDKRVMLAGFLRDLVVHMAMKKMGYKYVHSHEDEISAKIANAARAKGLIGDSGNKGHSSTIESEFEHLGCRYLDIIELCQTNDIEKIYQSWLLNVPTAKMILSDKPLDMYKLYQERLNEFIGDIRFYVEQEKREAKEYQYTLDVNDLQKRLDYADRLEKDGIKAHNPYLDIVVRRNASRLNQNYAKAMEKLKQNPKYPLLKTMLIDFICGKDWCKTPGGWKRKSMINDHMLSMLNDKIYG